MGKRQIQYPQVYGYGFDPEETHHHFMVIIPKSKKEKVRVYERFVWCGEEDLKSLNESRTTENKLKVAVPYHIWERLSSYLSQEFNSRLKKEGYKTYKWKKGNNPVNRLMGKELVLLLWAVEDVEDVDLLPKAIINWQGLRPEERWFLYGLANAATGSANEKNIGWRKGIKYGLLENPVDEKKIKQISFWDYKGGMLDEQ